MMHQNQKKTIPFTVKQLSEQPDLFPEALDAKGSRLVFCRMDADSYRKSPFLDHRIVKLSEPRFALPFAQLNSIRSKLQELGCHYIFHNAFCCSTVLTRYLDTLSGPLILREPNILYEVATLKRFADTPIIPRLSDISWNELYRFVGLMLGRRYAPEQPTIIKPTDGCNNLMQNLIARHPDNRALFIHSTIERFIASVLRCEQRHNWVRIRVRELLTDMQHNKTLHDINPNSLSVTNAAALVWLLHTEHYISSAYGADAQRFASLNAEQLIANPANCLVEVCRHLALSYTERQVLDAVAGANTDLNAKADQEPYNQEVRDRLYSETQNRYRDDIEQAIKWASNFSQERNLKDALPNPLPVSAE